MAIRAHNYRTVYVITWNYCAWYCSADVYRDDDMINCYVHEGEKRLYLCAECQTLSLAMLGHST
jgi:hypothetical protein